MSVISGSGLTKCVLQQRPLSVKNESLGEVDRVREHYHRVSHQFGIDGNVVHSWHAGIHPGCSYTSQASQNPDRWSNTVFTNPRFLHFHTCGNYAPGEICWMLLDHTIAIDGKKLWDRGRLYPEIFPQTKTCIERWPELNALFANPSDEIGIPLVTQF